MTPSSVFCQTFLCRGPKHITNYRLMQSECLQSSISFFEFQSHLTNPVSKELNSKDQVG